jgi:hypothetical protein
MKNNYIKLALKLLLATTPIFSILIFYVIADPFQVIYKYDYCSSVNTHVGLDKDYQSTERFIQNNPTYKYNSFIFGNSRSFFYQTNKLEKYTGGGNYFHFDASGESIYGINKKINFLDKQNVNIKNVLLVLDYETLIEDKNSTGHLFIKDPVLTGQNRLSFQHEFLSAFFNYNFLFAYIDLLVSKRVKPYMQEHNLFINTDNEGNCNCVTNEITFAGYDSIIKNSPLLYYTRNRVKIFYLRPTIQQISEPAILSNQVSMLNQIKDIFIKDKTSYKIVISPLYNQIKLNPKDLTILKQIFGAENVFDFSGKNKWTDDFHNYYENSHYRPNIADSVMKVIYSVK